VVRAGAFAVVAVALGLSREPGCGGVDDPQGGKNAPCTRDSDCKSTLKCSEGVCVDRSTSVTPPPDSGTSDSGTIDSGAETDASSDDGG
jgi:hypothetical protein